jgi:transcriptional regulator with XRE-family HTH domain
MRERLSELGKEGGVDCPVGTDIPPQEDTLRMYVEVSVRPKNPAVWVLRPLLDWCEQHNLRGSLPFCYFSLSAKRPLNSPYPKKKLVTLGDHIRKRRLDLGLFQKDVAVAIGVDTTTVYNWEKGHSEPELRFIPRIFGFLGYEPQLPKPSTLGEKILQYRCLKGISQKDLAKRIGIDPTTLSRLERSRGSCLQSVLRKVSDFLESSLGQR